MTADQVRSLQPALAALLGKFRDCFQKEPTFAHGERYLRGLLLDLKRKSVEPIALAAGVAVRTLQELFSAAFARWQVEKWFERAKQETGFGDFEVRTYTRLIRHWWCSRMAMHFLAEQTQRLRGKKSADHAGTSSPGGAYPGHEEVESVPALVGWADRAL